MAGLPVLMVYCKSKWGGLGMFLWARIVLRGVWLRKRTWDYFCIWKLVPSTLLLSFSLCYFWRNECSLCVGSCWGKRIYGFFPFNIKEWRECGSFCFVMEKLMHLQTDHGLWYEVKWCLLEKLKNFVLRTKVYFNIQKITQHPLVKKGLGNAWRVWVGELGMGGQQLVVCHPCREAGSGFLWPSVWKAGICLQLLSLLVRGWPMEPRVQLASPHSSWWWCQVSGLTSQAPLLIGWREGRGDSLRLQYWNGTGKTSWSLRFDLGRNVSALNYPSVAALQKINFP